MRILLVEDYLPLAQVIQTLLKHDYVVDIKLTATAALEAAYSFNYQLIILDLNLPDIDGITVLKELRANCIHCPILILTATNTLDSKINRLNEGADDYLTKPFNQAELLARVRALSRRLSTHKTNLLQTGQLTLNINTQTVTYQQHLIKLNKKEYQLLKLLLLNQGRVLNIPTLHEQIWDQAWELHTNTITVHINRLRNKLDKRFHTTIIKTIHARGYRID